MFKAWYTQRITFLGGGWFLRKFHTVDWVALNSLCNTGRPQTQECWDCRCDPLSSALQQLTDRYGRTTYTWWELLRFTFLLYTSTESIALYPHIQCLCESKDKTRPMYNKYQHEPKKSYELSVGFQNKTTNSNIQSKQYTTNLRYLPQQFLKICNCQVRKP